MMSSSAVSSYLSKFYALQALEEEEEKHPRALAVGRTAKHFIYLSSDVVHRYIGGRTNTGKTTLAQTIQEIDFQRGRKVLELEPALEAKNERLFMNMPNQDEKMVEVLEKYFDLEPRPFKARAYTIATRQYRNFVEKYDHLDASEFYRGIRLTDADIIDVVARIFPGGSMETTWVRGRYREYVEDTPRKYRSVEAFLEYLEDTGKGLGFTSWTLMKIRDVARTLRSDGDYTIEDLLKAKDEVSVFTAAFIDDPLDRYIFALAVLNLVYDRWKFVKRKDDVLSFFVADANLLAPRKQKDILDRLERYQVAMKQNLQIYVRISRGQGVVWTFDSQEMDDLDEAVVSQCEEIFIKRMRNKAVAERYGINYKALKALKKRYAYFDNGEMTRRILVRPPMSRKAASGEYLPIHFLKEWERWENEEATF